MQGWCKGVPLVAAAADVGDDEVLARADVHLVPALGVAVRIVELAREDRVACAGMSTIVSEVSFAGVKAVEPGCFAWVV